MPNKENIQKWIDALRSGNYQQTQGALIERTTDILEYCCLGVACEVYLKEHPEYDRLKFWAEHRLWMMLPHKVMDWLGFLTVNPSLALYDTCTNANDRMKATFEQIADDLEQTYLTPIVENNNA